MRLRRPTQFALILLVSFGLLAIPESDSDPGNISTSEPFIWNQDERWEALEQQFLAVRGAGCNGLSFSIDSLLRLAEGDVSSLSSIAGDPSDDIFDRIEHNVFTLGPILAACPDEVKRYIAVVSELRTAVKNLSRRWDVNARSAKHRMYRLLYGTRFAVEEVLNQWPERIPDVVWGNDEPSLTPSAMLAGMTIRSGDILVSRGGAATSALISRGNDYPGNFSHVALVHVDPATADVSIIESHIEKGVAIATPEEYMADTKLRIMVLRLRSDLPAMTPDPMLPHAAASMMLRDAQSRHIPYDFAMDFNDATKYFCSEVVSAAYKRVGVTLWMGLSSISSAGVASWLAAFGVEHFDTQEPADLEYDPQLRVVAEWRDPAMLQKDRIDNAVIDVMLEGAERGDRLTHDWYMLPFARIVKGYSAVLNLFGVVGPVPEGMSATSALKHKDFTARHNAIATKVALMAEEFENIRGYAPPYWELLKMARASVMM